MIPNIIPFQESSRFSVSILFGSDCAPPLPDCQVQRGSSIRGRCDAVEIGVL